MRSIAVALVAILLLVGIGYAQEAARAPQDILDLLASAGDTGEYPDANQIGVRSLVDIEYKDSGAFELYAYELTKLLTIKGCKDAREQRLPYHRRYGSIEIPLARVIKKDGTVLVVGEDYITDGTMAEVARMNIFETDLRERVVTFQNLEEGDAIEYEMVLKFKPLVKGHFSQEIPFEAREPRRYLEIKFRGPKKMPLHHRVYGGDVEFQFSLEGKNNIYRWIARDTKQIIPEPGMVALQDVAMKLAVSTDTSWKRLSGYAYKMYEPNFKADKKIKAKVRELVQGLRTNEEKIRAIQHYISSTVRYVGVAMDRGAFIEPHKASYTFDKQYGVCRDVAVLTVAMLAEAGIPGDVVFVNPQKRTEPESPTLSFMHAVVAIPNGTGGYRYIDPTLMQNTPVVDDAYYLSDRNVLHLVEGGSDLKRIPHYSPENSLGQTVARSVLDSDGNLTSEISMMGLGLYDLILRMIAGNANPAELKLFWQEFLSESLPGAHLLRFEVSDPAELSRPMQFDMTVEVSDYVLDAERYLLTPMLLARTEMQILNLMFERLVELPERKYPAQLGAPLGFEETETLILPPGYTVRSLPDPVSVEEGIFRMAAEYTPSMSEGGSTASIKYRRRLLVDSRIIDPEDYQILKRVMSELARSTKGEIVLARLER